MTGWRFVETKRRCAIVASARHLIANRADQLVDDVASPLRFEPSETVAGELIPLCDALSFLGRSGAKILRDRKIGVSGRPLWLFGVRSVVQRVPRGVVLVIGTWNYPLFLSGVQVAQALAAGNQVLLKPAPGCERSSQSLARCFWDSGIDASDLKVLNSDSAAAIGAMRSGVDLVVLTGGVETGKKVLAQAAERLTPAIVELSGCDALLVLPGADLDRVAASIRFGLTFNSGATCIGPRRLFVQHNQVNELKIKLAKALSDAPDLNLHATALGNLSSLRSRDPSVLAENSDEPIKTMRPTVLSDIRADAAIANADLFAPVASLIEYSEIDEAISAINACQYGLAASVFGPLAEAQSAAEQLDVGSVLINDLIAATADPRLPFGGRRSSGFGTTRGVEGLLEMTVPKVISVRRGGPMPHLRHAKPADVEILTGALQYQHGSGIRNRLSGLRRLFKGFKLSKIQQ